METRQPSVEEINENIRHHRLYRIQITEEKIRKFRKVYDEIKERLVIKYSKNISLNIIRVVLGILTILFLGSSFIYFSPDRLGAILESNRELLAQNIANDILLYAQFLGYAFLVFAFISCCMGYLLKKNIKSRNSIFKLNKLVKEVIEYMETSSEDEKRKYEFYVDHLQEIENLRKMK